MFPQSLIRNSLGGLNVLLNSCKLPLVSSQRFVRQAPIFSGTNFNDRLAPKAGTEDDILYKRIEIETRSGDRAVLDSYLKFVTMAAENLEITLSRT